MSSPLLRSAYALSLCWPALIYAQPPAESRSPEVIQQRLNEPQLAVVWSPDGNRVVCSGQNRAVRQFDRAGKELEPARNGSGGWSVSYALQGGLVAVCGLDRSIRLWDPISGAELRSLDGHLSTAWVAAFLPDGQRLVSAGEDGTIRIWGARDGTEIGQVTGHSGPIWCMALSRDGRLIATGGSDGAVRIWDLATGRLRRICEGNHSGGVWPVVFSPDGRTIASAGWQDGKLFLWETSTGKLRRQIPHPTGIKCVAFTPEGNCLVTGGNDSVIRFWDLLAGKELSPLEGHRGVVNGISISPNGALLASASADNTFRLWDISRRKTIAVSLTLPARQIEACWAELRRDGGIGAYDAAGMLASCPDQTLALLEQRLRATPQPNLPQIIQLIEATNHKNYAKRERASVELVRLGEAAESELTRAIHQSNTLETRIRAERALEKVQGAPLTGEALQHIRSVEVLERIATPQARVLLERLAAGSPHARLTGEAAASLKRLDTLAGR
jgi:WD40 repeat protein